MKVMCKRSMSYHNVRMNRTFSVTNGRMYDYQYDKYSNKQEIVVIEVIDYYGISYLFRLLDFTNYFYTEKEYRKLKLQKLNEKCSL